jgi:hypothetical protein
LKSNFEIDLHIIIIIFSFLHQKIDIWNRHRLRQRMKFRWISGIHFNPSQPFLFAWLMMTETLLHLRKLNSTISRVFKHSREKETRSIADLKCRGITSSQMQITE